MVDARDSKNKVGDNLHHLAEMSDDTSSSISLLTPAGAAHIVHTLVQSFAQNNRFVVVALDLDRQTLVHTVNALRPAYARHGGYEIVAACSGYKPAHYDRFTTSRGATLGVHLYFRGDKLPRDARKSVVAVLVGDNAHECDKSADECAHVRLEPELHVRRQPCVDFCAWRPPKPVSACTADCEYSRKPYSFETS